MIEKVDSSKLNLMHGEYGFWFRGPQEDFSIIFNEKSILYFEFNTRGAHLSGGVDKMLRFGRIKHDPSEKAVGFKRADLIEYESEIPEGLIDEALRFIEQCDFDPKMKSAVMEHLRGNGRSKSLLQSDEGFESYHEALKNHQVKKSPNKWARQIKALVLTLLFLALVFWTYSLINISEYERTCHQGDASSCQRLIFIEMLRGNKERVEALGQLEKRALTGKAHGQMKEKCEAGDFDACLKLHQTGAGNLSENRLLDWACRGGNQEYCLDQALGYLRGKELPIDEASLSKVHSVLENSSVHQEVLRAIEFATGPKICEQGQECFQAGELLAGHGLSNLALKLYVDACQFKSREGCLAAAQLFDRVGQKQRAVALYREDCLATKTPKSCFQAAFAKYDDPADRVALRDAFDRCQKGAENYCMFLYDRVAR